MKVFAAVVAFSCLLAFPAQAGDPERAARLFDEALELMDAGDHAAGCSRFAESMAAEPSGGTALNLARCDEMNGRTASAWRHTLRAMKLFAESGESERERFARQKAAEIEPTLSTLTIVVAEDPDLVVRRNGVRVPAAELGARVPVDPGEHEIEVTGAGRAPWSTRVLVRGEAHAAIVEVPSIAPTAVLDPQPEPAPEREDAVLVGGAILLGLGGATAIAGAVVGGVVIAQTRDAEGSCPERQCPDMASYDALEPIRERALASNILLGVGGGLAVIGAVMLLVEATTSGEAEVVIAPSAGPNGGGVTARLRF